MKKNKTYPDLGVDLLAHIEVLADLILGFGDSAQLFIAMDAQTALGLAKVRSTIPKSNHSREFLTYHFSLLNLAPMENQNSIIDYNFL